MTSIPAFLKNMQTIQERFASKYIPIPEAGCWIWEGSVDHGGYGQFKLQGGKNDRAHRVSWFLHKGEIPEGMQICHRCDNPSCVNPEHLFLGTHKDNHADKKQKKRGKNQYGELPNHTCSKGHVGTYKVWNGKRYCLTCQKINYLRKQAC